MPKKKETVKVEKEFLEKLTKNNSDLKTKVTALELLLNKEGGLFSSPVSSLQGGSAVIIEMTVKSIKPPNPIKYRAINQEVRDIMRKYELLKIEAVAYHKWPNQKQNVQ